MKKKLAQLIPWDMKLDAQRRWFGVDSVVRRIEGVGKEHYKLEGQKVVNTLKGLKTYEDEDFRIRVVKQENLVHEVNASDRTVKWGWYLRAPQVYFDVLHESKKELPRLDDVADVSRGITTNNVGFFYLTPDRITHWAIEDQFILSPVIYTPKEVPNIGLDESRLRYSLFVCNKSRRELIGTNALKYIESAELQGLHQSLSFQGRSDWYSLGRIEPAACSLFYARQDDKFRVVFNPKGFAVNDNLYTIVPKEGVDNELLCALLNSSFFALGLELNGRINLGEGALKVQAYELGLTRLLDPRNLTDKEREEIIQTFRDMLRRPTHSIFEEVRMKDRQRLDRLVLKALGLDPKQYLKPIYDGLTELVRERIELANMRKKVKQVKTQKNIDKIEKQVIEEVLPQGVKKFPEEFLALSLKAKDFQDVSVPGEPLKLGMYFLGTQEVITDSGFIYQAKTIEEAKYLIYAQKPDSFIVKIPKDTAAMTKAVNDYERYLRELKGKLFQALLNATFNYKLADTLAQRLFVERGLPDIGT